MAAAMDAFMTVLVHVAFERRNHTCAFIASPTERQTVRARVRVWARVRVGARVRVRPSARE